jgi:hypothetical protein
LTHVLADLERARKWAIHPKISLTDVNKDLTPVEAEAMALSSDTYVANGTSIETPVPTMANWELQVLAASYHLASQMRGIMKDEAAMQDSIDLLGIADGYIERINSGIGTAGAAGGADNPRIQTITSSYRNYRLNPDKSPYLSQF